MVDQRSLEGPPTLESVARLAGVSRATAGRVLSGAPKVSEQARDAVLDAAAQLSYVTNRAARSLVTRRADSVAFVVTEPGERAFTDPFLPAVLRGAHEAMADHALQLVFVVLGSVDERERFFRFAAGGHVDGAVFVSVHADDPLPARLAGRGVPVVLSGRPFHRTDSTPYVGCDNVGGAGLALQALVQAGCRRIAAITGPDDVATAVDRRVGFERALAVHGRRLVARRVVTGDYTMESGRAAMSRLLSHRQGPDGVFVANDTMAVGALRAARDAGVRVPDDLRVVGFDDVPLARFADPALTTVRQPMQRLGRELGDLLVAQVHGEPAPRSVLLPTELVRRASC